jgi:hypothetical protein
MTAACYPDGQGAVPTWIAAFIMVGIGAFLARLALRARSN